MTVVGPTDPAGVVIVAHLRADRLPALVIDPGFAAVVQSSAVLAVFSRVLEGGGDLTVALVGDLVVGYVTVHPLEPLRWEGRVYHRRWEELRRAVELGSIEVSRDWRGRRIAERLVVAAMSGGTWDDQIVVSEELSWHWDYEELHLTVREYRALLVRLLSKGGFVEYRTDEPNVRLDAANIFMARIGPLVSDEDRRQFDALLITGRSEAGQLGTGT